MNELSRSNFIKGAGSTDVALWLGLSANGTARKTSVAGAASIAAAKKFTPFIHIEPNGHSTLFNTKPEMGQGTYQSRPALIAEEFEVLFEQVTIKNTGVEKKFGNGQRAGGNTSVRGSCEQMRKIGASAKAVFITAASTKWGVNEADCYAENGKIIHHPSQKTATYHNMFIGGGYGRRLYYKYIVEAVNIAKQRGRIKGVGEPGIPPFAPALANAIFAATGKRLRNMLFNLQNI